MKLRALLLACTAAAAVVTALVGAGLVAVAGLAREDSLEQAESMDVSRGIANLLALTNELAVFGGERAAAQWRSRHEQLMGALARAAQRHAQRPPELAELGEQVADLPALFEPLALLEPGPPGTLVQRRRELLLERLMTETQQMVEISHRWTLALGQRQQAAQRRYAATLLAAPLALLLLLAALAWLLSRRVLRPLARMQAAAQRLQAGDLSARCANDAADELGDAARAVDAMASALATSRQRMKTINDTMPAFVGHVDAEQRYTFANEHFRRADGRDPDALVGRSMREVRGDEVHAKLLPWITRALAGETVNFETTRVVDGRTEHRQSTYVPDRDEAGCVRGFYAMTFDVTERKQAELRAAAGERRIKAITDNLPALVAHIDASERYTFVNAHIGRVFGVDPQAMLGRTMREVRGAAIYADIEPHVRRALAGQTVNFESAGEVGGRQYHYQASYVPDIDEAGVVQGFYAMTFDISARKLAELRQAASEQRLQAITDNVPALVAYIDHEGRYRFANNKYGQWMGTDPAGMLGRPVHEVLDAQTHAQVREPLRQALGGEHQRFERHAGRAGGDRVFLTEYIPDRDASGGVLGCYALSVDITALKAAQAQQAAVERRLRAITDNLPVLISYLDRDERTTFLNATVRRWLGQEPEHYLGKPLADTAEPAHYAQRAAYIRRALAGERVEFELESVAPVGTLHLQNVYIPDVQADGSVAGIFTLSTDVTALKESQRQLDRLARVDSLTGLPNRRQFEEVLAQATARAARADAPLALMFLDVDYFKSINDRLGHAGGDTVLKEFARRLKHSVRSTDTPARLAGDEFVVLLEGLHAAGEAEMVAEKVITAIRRPFTVNGQLLRVTTSVGVAYTREPPRDSGLMDLADGALYEAKDAGRDTWRLRVEDAAVVLAAGQAKRA